MTLFNDFYTITRKEDGETDFVYEIALNKGHFIYRAHFPDNPITPGVCIIQIAKELAEEILQTPLLLKVVKNVKFMQVINPLQHSRVTFSVAVVRNADDEGYKVNAEVTSSETTFAKMSLMLIEK
jgi:3-hydroxyacyl-[acyl-carrier-protein] dehydratase